MSDTKEKVKKVLDHLFKSGDMQYGLFKEGKPYTVSTAEQMQRYYRKKMDLDDDAPISIPQFRKVMNNTFKIQVKNIPAANTDDEEYDKFIKENKEELPEKAKDEDKD